MTRRKGVYGNRRIWERVEKWDKKLNPKDFAVYLDQTKPLARELFTEYQGIQETIMKMIKPIVDRYGSEFARFQAYMWFAMQCWYIKQRYKDEALKKMTNALYIYWTIAGLREEILREIACMVATCPDTMDVIVQNYLHVTIVKPTMSINYSELEQVITKAIIDALVQEKLTDLYDNVYNAIKNNPTLQSIIQLLQTLLSKYLYDIDFRKNLGQLIDYLNYLTDEWKNYIKISGSNVTVQVVDNTVVLVLNPDNVPFTYVNEMFNLFMFPSSCSKLLQITIPASGVATVEVHAPAGLSTPFIILTGIAITDNNVIIEVTSPRIFPEKSVQYPFNYPLKVLYNYFTSANSYISFLAYRILPISVLDSKLVIRIVNKETSSVNVYLLPVTIIPLSFVEYNKEPILTRLFAVDNTSSNYVIQYPNNAQPLYALSELLAYARSRCFKLNLTLLYVSYNLSSSSLEVGSFYSAKPIAKLCDLTTSTCTISQYFSFCSTSVCKIPFKVFYEYGCAPLNTYIYVTASSSETTWFLYGASSLLPVSKDIERTWTENVNISTTLSPLTAPYSPVIYPTMNDYVGVRHIKSASLSITTGSYSASVFIEVPCPTNNNYMKKIATINANTTQTVNINERCIAIYIIPTGEETITVTGTVEWSDCLLL